MNTMLIAIGIGYLTAMIFVALQFRRAPVMEEGLPGDFEISAEETPAFDAEAGEPFSTGRHFQRVRKHPRRSRLARKAAYAEAR
jgi:hypothetical protein